MNLQELVEAYPNDMELGKKIREIYLTNKKVLEKYKHLKIYESPDGGNTVYERPFGGDYTTKKLVK
tara:strand:- start:4561 stop:4758 length:198 start_codon:yes stop_codon:yes gene_type:complete